MVGEAARKGKSGANPVEHATKRRCGIAVACGLVLLVGGMAAAPADAEGPRIRVQRVKRSALPAALEVRGELVHALRWHDANGENFAVFSRKVDRRSNGATLHVVHGAGRGRAWRQLYAVEDGITCGLWDAFVDFVGGVLDVTDVDGDGLAELTFAYRRGCATDAAPITVKLLVLENGSKLVIRGREADGSPPAFDASWAEAPAPVLRHAFARWGERLGSQRAGVGDKGALAVAVRSPTALAVVTGAGELVELAVPKGCNDPEASRDGSLVACVGRSTIDTPDWGPLLHPTSLEVFRNLEHVGTIRAWGFLRCWQFVDAAAEIETFEAPYERPKEVCRYRLDAMEDAVCQPADEESEGQCLSRLHERLWEVRGMQ